MKHLKRISKSPAHAADIPVDVKIQFIVAILTAFSPILEAKSSESS